MTHGAWGAVGCAVRGRGADTGGVRQRAAEAKPGFESVEKLPEKLGKDGTTILVGDPDAKMTVHLYEDPRCPVCEEFETTGGSPKLREAMLDRRAITEYTLASFLDDRVGGSGSKKAVNALRAALEEGKFVEYHEVLYANQPEESVDGYTAPDRIDGNRAFAYRIHLDVDRGRWYLTASWTRPTVKTVPLDTARAGGMVGVDTNADHFAAYRLDPYGNPVGDPRRFSYDLTGSADHRDAQIRHALTQLLHWTKQTGATAIGIENLDFAAEKTREKQGRRKQFRQLISGMPTGKLKARIVSIAAEHGLAIVAVDPAYTSMWGDQHWRKPLTSKTRNMTRHDAASVAIGRRALGHSIRRRTAPPQHHQSDGAGHRTLHADRGLREREEPRQPVTERAGDARPRTKGTRMRATSASNTVRDARSSATWVQDSLLDTVEER